MATPTALDVITDALRELGAIAIEEVPTAAEAAVGLTRLNNLLSSWGIDPLMNFDTVPIDIPLIAGQDTYSIATGTSLNIKNAYISTQAGLSFGNPTAFQYNAQILNSDEYSAITQKNLTGLFPWGVYPSQGTLGTMSVMVYPVPNNNNYTLVLWADYNNIIPNLSGTGAFFSYPPAYYRAIVTNLALELAPMYGKTPSPLTVKIAQESKAEVMRNNLELTPLSIDPNLQAHGTGFYNYLTDGY